MANQHQNVNIAPWVMGKGKAAGSQPGRDVAFLPSRDRIGAAIGARRVC